MIDPISLIITALVAGATAAAKDTAEQANKDVYKGLKDLIKKKFIDDSFGQGIVDGKPEEIKQVEGLLKDKLAQSGADKDVEIIKLAQELLEKENSEESAAGKFIIKAQDSNIGVVGDNAKIEGGINFGQKPGI